MVDEIGVAACGKCCAASECFGSGQGKLAQVGVGLLRFTVVHVQLVQVRSGGALRLPTQLQ